MSKQSKSWFLIRPNSALVMYDRFVTVASPGKCYGRSALKEGHQTALGLGKKTRT
jgi:hypothetical protein